MTIADGPGALALEIGKALSIAVVDYGGFVVLVERMDGARPMSPSIAAAVGAGVEQRDTLQLVEMVARYYWETRSEPPRLGRLAAVEEAAVLREGVHAEVGRQVTDH